jgi:hypothetical protein
LESKTQKGGAVMPQLTFSSQTSLLSDFDSDDSLSLSGEVVFKPIDYRGLGPVVLGSTFEPKVDRERLSSQQRRVEELVSDGEPRTLYEIAVALRKLYPHTHFPEASISARLRDMRRVGYIVERTRKSAKSGLWVYRAVKTGVAA